MNKGITKWPYMKDKRNQVSQGNSGKIDIFKRKCNKYEGIKVLSCFAASIKGEVWLNLWVASRAKRKK